MAIERLVSEKVLVLAHACDAVRAALPLNVPAVEADHRLMWLRVSVVPPFVHEDAIDDIAFEPPEAAAIVACTRVVDPAAAAVAPAAPGSPVWSLTKQVAVAKVPSSQPLTTLEDRPVATVISFRWLYT
jgi:hypothetical protein